MPQNKLDIQATPESTAFYIEGSLQFDTRDEFIYHETLVIPAASLLSARVTRPANALVLGGGDGLALRELLKFDMFRRIDLVDYDPEVIRCGKTTFAPWNRDALYDSKVRVIVDEAQRYLHTSRKVYDLIVADFTFPDNLAASQLFTTAFYDLIKKRLSSKGFVTLNAISPETSSPAYWSIFKTLASLKLHPIPLRAKIPSFISHGYGEWGFFLSSPSPVLSRELKRIRLSVPSRYLTKESLLEGMRFSKTGTALGLSLATVLSEPSDLLCFLNMPVQAAADHGEQIDFSKRLSAKDLRALGIQYDLIASGMTAEWCERLIKVWLELDWEALLSETEKNIKRNV